MDLKGKHLDRTGSVKDAISSKAAPLAPITSDTDAEPHGPTHEDDPHADADAENETEAEGSAQAQAGAASVVRRPTEASQTDREDAHVFEVVRRDLLLGP